MLVRAGGIDPQLLWAKLYQCQPGSIRKEFPRILGELRGRAFSQTEAQELWKLADQLFDEANGERPATFVTATVNHLRWKRVLR